MLVLPDIYVLKKEIIPRNNFIENNLINKFDEKKINNENYDKNNQNFLVGDILFIE